MAEAGGHTHRTTEKEQPMHAIPTYEDEQGNVVAFRKVQGFPGFTHRVIVNGKQSGWLAREFKPSAANATYFLTEAQRKSSKS
jgi:hypothetical protein